MLERAPVFRWYLEKVYLNEFLWARVEVNPIVVSVGLLICSNIFMTFAWYAHLKELNNKPWIIAALMSWGIALFEYLLQVPANRIGYTALNVGQLKILQEVITLMVFVPFSVFYLREPLKLDYLWAGLCLVGAVYFAFRSKFS
ncbi:membrane protein [Vibrio vulnificus]|uniref:Membrane protein n=2 Tax=Vibrio TaxID=662 RepID=A0AAN1PPG5_VIBVL|nr:membrane protein [Vibrio vulnificus]